MPANIQVKKHEGNYFYKAYNFMPEELLPEFFKSTSECIESRRKSTLEEIFPPEATRNLIDVGDPAECLNESVWIKFYEECKKHIAQYCKITGIDINNISLHSSWITRLHNLDFKSVHSRKELERRLSLHSTFGNMHSHTGNPIGLVYYLKNPDPKYGTIVKISDKKIFNNNGEENSVLIFNPELYHTALYPPLKITENYPRITIVADCEYSS